MRDLDALQWIRKDIVELFHDASSKLERYIGSHDDEYLDGTSRLLEEAVSILKLFSARGAALVCAEMLANLRHYASLPDPDRDAYEFVNLMIGALNYLPGHLAEIISNGRDYPELILGTVNQLRAWRKAPALQNSQVFFYDFSEESLYREASDQARMHNRVGSQVVDPEKCNYIFRQSFLQWLRDPKDKESVFKVIYILQLLRDQSRNRHVKFFWWLCEVVFEAIYFECLKINKQLLQISSRIQKETTRIITLEQKKQKVSVSMDLVREVLYCIALARPETDAIKAIQKKFNLDFLVPTKGELAHINRTLTARQLEQKKKKIAKFLHNLLALQTSIDVVGAKAHEGLASVPGKELAGLAIGLDLVSRELPAQLMWLHRSGQDLLQSVTEAKALVGTLKPLDSTLLERLSDSLSQTLQIVHDRMAALEKDSSAELEKTQVLGQEQDKTPAKELAAFCAQGLARVESLFSRYLSGRDAKYLLGIEEIFEQHLDRLNLPPLNDLKPVFTTMLHWVRSLRNRPHAHNTEDIELFSELLVLQQYISSLVSGARPGDPSVAVRRSLERGRELGVRLDHAAFAGSPPPGQGAKHSVWSSQDETIRAPAPDKSAGLTQTLDLPDSMTLALDPDAVFIEREFINEIDRVTATLEGILNSDRLKASGRFMGEDIDSIIRELEILTGGVAMLGKQLLSDCATYLHRLFVLCREQGVEAGSPVHAFFRRFVELIPLVQKVIVEDSTDTGPLELLVSQMKQVLIGLEEVTDPGKGARSPGRAPLPGHAQPGDLRAGSEQAGGADGAPTPDAGDGHRPATRADSIPVRASSGDGRSHTPGADADALARGAGAPPPALDADKAADKAADAGSGEVAGGPPSVQEEFELTSYDSSGSDSVPGADTVAQLSAQRESGQSRPEAAERNLETEEDEPVPTGVQAIGDPLDLVDELLDLVVEEDGMRAAEDAEALDAFLQSVANTPAQSPIQYGFTSTLGRMHRFAQEARDQDGISLRDFYRSDRIEALIALSYVYIKACTEGGGQDSVEDLARTFEECYQSFVRPSQTQTPDTEEPADVSTQDGAPATVAAGTELDAGAAVLVDEADDDGAAVAPAPTEADDDGADSDAREPAALDVEQAQSDVSPTLMAGERAGQDQLATETIPADEGLLSSGDAGADAGDDDAAVAPAPTEADDDGADSDTREPAALDVEQAQSDVSPTLMAGERAGQDQLATETIPADEGLLSLGDAGADAGDDDAAVAPAPTEADDDGAGSDTREPAALNVEQAQSDVGPTLMDGERAGQDQFAAETIPADEGLLSLGDAGADTGDDDAAVAPAPTEADKALGLQSDIESVESLTEKLFFDKIQSPQSKTTEADDLIAPPTPPLSGDLDSDSADQSVMTTGKIEAEVLGVFLDESRTILDTLRDHIDKVLRDREKADESHLLGIKRQLHTLKGGLLVVGLRRLPAIIHACESLIDSATPSGLCRFVDDFLKDFVDWFLDSLEQIGRRQVNEEIGTYQRRLDSLSDSYRREQPTQSTDPQHDQPRDATEAARAARPPGAPEPEVADVRQQGVGKEKPAGDRSPVAEQIRVRGQDLSELHSTLSELLSLGLAARQILTFENKSVEELSVLTEDLDHQLRATDGGAQSANRLVGQNRLSRWEALRDSLNSLSDRRGELRDFVFSFDRQLSRLRENIYLMSQVRFGSLESMLALTARRACEVLGRKARLLIDGAEVSMEKNLLDKLSPALEHIVRNSVTHGIENPDQRRQAGKSEIGEIRVSCLVEHGEYKISVSDDGGGIDVEKLMQESRRTGIEINREVDNETLLQIISTQGISTSMQANELSGRGIGMDAVAHTVRLIGGRMALRNFPGRGCRFELIIPVTASAVKVAQIDVCGLVCCMRVARIVSVQQLPAQRLRRLMNKTAVFRFEGRDYGLIDLAAAIFGPESREAARWQRSSRRNFQLLLFCLEQDRRVAFVVDKVIGFSEQMMSSISPQLVDLDIYTEVCILENARPSLVLSREALIRQNALAKSGWAEQNLAGTVPAREQEGDERLPHDYRPDKLRVLVVDDSLTVRRAITYALRDSDIRIKEVHTCPNNAQAIDFLRSLKPDLIFVDVDDSHAHIPEFLSLINADEEDSTAPLVLMCSAQNIDERRSGLKLNGVHDFLAKPFSLDELRKKVQTLLEPSEAGDPS